MKRLESFVQYIEDAMKSWDCPGVALAVVKGNDVIYQNVFGLRDVENKLPMTEDTRFAMASVTKSFTAMSVALLVDDGKLEWDKPVREYMPEFILSDSYVTEHVTIRDMLCHRTGLPRHDCSAWRLDLSKAEFIKKMKHFKFSATFREKFQYNNLMYVGAAYLVEKIAEMKWEDFVKERIFSPLGMIASNFQPEPPQKEQINALGYRIDRNDDGVAKGLINTSFGLHTDLSPGSYGALFSTLADLSNWIKVHVDNGKFGDKQFISSDNLKQMHLPQMIFPGGGFYEALLGNTIFTCGMGWFIEPYKGYTLVHHGGNVEGHSLIIGFVPQESLGVIALTNIGLLPFETVLLYESIDRALDLPDRDWNKKFHEMFDPIIFGEAKAKQTAATEKLDDAPTTHPIDTYLGVYESDGYPDFAVRMENETFQACTVGSFDWSELRHYHYNVFEWHLEDFDEWMKIRFLINDNGEIDSISIPIEPEVDNVIFTRKHPDLSDDIVSALVGVYDLPIDGMVITITAHEGKIFAAQTGNPPKELTPYKLNSEVIGFKQERDRLDFVREDDSITSMVLKTQYMTLDAPKTE